MNKQRKTSHILNVFQYDADGHVILPASLTLSIAPTGEDNSGKVPTTAWVRSVVGGAVTAYTPTSRTITINGTSYDLSSNRSWSIDTGVLTATAGSGISVSVVSQNLNIVNTGLLTATAGAGISVSTVSQNLNIVNTGLLTATAGSGITVSVVGQNLNVVNTGILTATAGSGISLSVVGQNLNVVNTGILTATAGAGISVSVVNGNLNVVNTITNNNQLTNGAGYITSSALTGYATETYVGTAISNLIDAAPGTLDTLNELAAALGDDPNFATTVATSIGTKQAQLNGTGFVKVTGTTVSYDNSTYLTTSSAASTYVALAGSYANPAWITSLAWSKITGAPTTISGYGITNAYTDAQIQNFFNGANAITGYNKSNWDTAFGWGNHASAGYLTTSSAASTYVSLTGSYANPSWITSLAYSKITGVPAFLTSYTETDTLSSVTGRGASTSTAVTFSGGATISNLLLNGAAAYTEGSLALGAHGTTEGGQLVLNKATSHTFAAHLDVWQDVFRILYGTNTATSGVAMSLNLSTRQLILPQYTTSTTFTGTAAGVLAFDSSGNILTIAVPGGAVSSVSGGTGVSVNSTTGAVVVSIGQSVATSAQVTFDSVITNNNGNGTNFRIGDDVWIGDINAANTFRIQGVQNAANAYIVFGNGDTTALGRAGTGALTYGGNTIYHAGNLTNLNQLTNGPGYITSYTETDTLATVTARGASTSTALTISGVIISTSGSHGYVRPAASNGSLLLGDDSGSATRGIVVNNNGGAVISTAASGQIILDTQISGTSVLRVNGNQTVTILGNTVWHAGNLTNLNQLSNGPGYITGYTETDTFATVTSRGASTSTAVTVSNNFTANDLRITTGYLRSDSAIYNLTLGGGAQNVWSKRMLISESYYGNDGLIPFGSGLGKNTLWVHDFGASRKHGAVISCDNNGEAHIYAVDFANSTGDGTIGGSAGGWGWNMYYDGLGDEFFRMRIGDGGTWTEVLTIDRYENVRWKNTTGFSINGNTVLHSGNYSSYALPLSGGTLTNKLQINANWGGSNPERFTIRGTYPSIALRTTQHDMNWLIHNDDSLSFYSAAGVDSDNWGLRMRLNTSGVLQVNGNTVLTAGNYTSYTYSTTDADSRFLRGTTNPGSVNNFTISIGNNGSYSYVQSHSSQPLELNPVGNTVRIAGNVVWHQGNLTNLNQLTNGPGYIVPNSSVSGWISFSSSTQGTPIIRAVQQDTTSGFYLFQGVTGSTEVFRVDRSGTITTASDSIQLNNGSFRWRHSGDWVYAGNSSGDYGGNMGVAAQKYWSQGDYYFGTRAVWLSSYLNQAVLTTSAPTFSGIGLNGSIVNNNDGAVLMESNASENNNWLFKENSKTWGIFYFNRGSQSGQNIGGGYVSVGAETLFMGGNAGIAMPSSWTGYIAGSNIAAYIDHNTGHMFAAGSMRSPIFFDSANPTYYLDPNAITSIRTVGSWRSDSSSWDGEFNGKIQYHSNHWYIQGADLLIFRNSGGSNVFTVNQSGSGVFNGSLSISGNTALHAGNYTSWAAPRSYVGDSYVDFTIYGDQNTYYPVTIHNWNGGYGFQRYSIHRGYSWNAPWNPIGTGAHQGGLTFTFEWSGDIAWGGNDKSVRVTQFSEQYTSMVAGMQLAHCEGVVVWLRGGGSGGAHYRLHGPGGLSQSYSINMSSWTSCAGVTYSPRSYSGSTVDSEINSRFSIRGSGSGDIFVNNQAVIHSGNIGSQSVSNSSSLGGYSSGTYLGKFGNGNGYYQSDNWIQVNGSHGIFWPSYYSLHIRPNISSSYTQMEIIGSKNSYGGIYDNHSAVNGFMYDGGGNGGVYREASGGRWYWYYHVGNACMGINTSTTSSSYAAYVNGNLYATGDITAYSDRRKKTDIVTIDNALDKVTKLRGVYYNKIDDLEKGRQTGVIAQEINEVLPEVVTYAADVDEYGVKYGNIVGVLIEAIKEQQKQIEELQDKLNSLIQN